MASRVAAGVALAVAACTPLGEKFEPVVHFDGGGCPLGAVSSDSGVGCEPLFAVDCPAGSRPVLGRSDCEPVGWVDCPAGFERTAGAWGCRDVQPAAACTGAQIERLGETTCRPIGSCDAFPPAGASLFVDDDFSTTDATHFRSVAAAVAAAPANAVIAIEAGTYPESVELTRSVTLVGRCAERVTLRGAAGVPGVGVRAAITAEVRGVSLVGFGIGVGASRRGQLTLREVAILSSGEYGVYASDVGTTVRLVDSAVRDTTRSDADVGHGAQVEAGAVLELTGVTLSGHHRYGVFATGTGSTVTAERVIVRDNLATPTGFGGMGVVADPGSTVRLTLSAVSGSRHRGVRVTNATLVARQTVVRDTAPRSDGTNGDGCSAFQGAHVTLDRVTLADNSHAAVHLQEPGTTLDATDCSIAGIRRGPAESVGASASVGAVMNLKSVSVTAVPDYPVSYFQAAGTVERSFVGHNLEGYSDGPSGLNVTDSCITVDDSALVDNAMIAAAVVGGADAGCTTRLTRTLLAQTRPRSDGVAGRGLSVHAGDVQLDDSVLWANRETGMWASRGARVVALRSVISATQADGTGLYGYGAVVRTGAQLQLVDVDVRACAAVGVAIAGGSGMVRGGLFASNAIALDVRDGTVLRTNELPQLVSGELQVGSTTAFVGNGSQVGSGTVPLPQFEPR